MALSLALVRHNYIRKNLTTNRDGRIEPATLDPQDMGLAVLTGQWGSDGPLLGAPTCWLSGQMHSVWPKVVPCAGEGLNLASQQVLDLCEQSRCPQKRSLVVVLP
jgi:hypothetical protein